MYQKVGVVEAWPNQKDQGRFETTKQEVDRMMFKVPSLRNTGKLPEAYIKPPVLPASTPTAPGPTP